MKGCFVCERRSQRLGYVYREGRQETFAQLIELCPEIIHEDNLEENRQFLQDTEVILTSWDMVPFTARQLEEYFPRLRLVLYAAGSVQYFARPFLERGVIISTAREAMAQPVAQFTVSTIIMANKGAFLAQRLYHAGQWEQASKLGSTRFPGTYGTKVGILGAGAIGSLVLKMLQDYPVKTMVYDPFLPPEQARALGAQPCSLETLFSECQSISNHLADNPQTAGMLDYRLFSRMKDTAAFINTGRGAQVVEADLVRALKEAPERCAILDVTHPEPVAPDSPLLQLPNVFLFPHIAGSARQEVLLFADAMLEELRRYLQGLPLQHTITLKMLPTMA